MNSTEFYHSKAWRQLSQAFLQSEYYICERCGKPAALAHHKTHLNAANYSNPEISLNADLLQAVCLEGHNTIHYGAGGAVLQGLEFTPEGEIIKT